ncbi:hypothetical protein [Rhodococcus opacus]|uniref:hypothetical protein n=1 Tax=Rhodococcus opacus TaxID=37919 RepID=UPI0029490239|nr:hypothetical protein [Rhodococcus opacus]MDV6247031.1 hypothetical protein [Rhodococcus opacus]
MEVVGDGGVDVDVTAKPVHDRGRIRITASATVSDRRSKSVRKSLFGRPFVLVEGQVEDVGADLKCLPLPRRRVAVASFVDRGDSVQVPGSVEQLSVHLGLAEDEADLHARHQLLEFLGCRQPRTSCEGTIEQPEV